MRVLSRSKKAAARAMRQGYCRCSRGPGRQERIAPGARPRPRYFFSSFTGSTVRPKVEFVTAAKDAYHAAIAVAIPM